MNHLPGLVLYELPDGPCQYKRTPQFVKERFLGNEAPPPYMAFYAASPGEAVVKFKKYYSIGKALGAYC